MQKWKNSVDPEEFHVFIKCGNEQFYITGRYDSRKEINGNMVTINSIGTLDGKTMCGSNDLKEMKNLLGLSGTTTEIETKIFNVLYNKLF